MFTSYINVRVIYIKFHFDVSQYIGENKELTHYLAKKYKNETFKINKEDYDKYVEKKSIDPLYEYQVSFKIEDKIVILGDGNPSHEKQIFKEEEDDFSFTIKIHHCRYQLLSIIPIDDI